MMQLLFILNLILILVNIKKLRTQNSTTDSWESYVMNLTLNTIFESQRWRFVLPLLLLGPCDSKWDHELVNVHPQRLRPQTDEENVCQMRSGSISPCSSVV